MRYLQSQGRDITIDWNLLTYFEMDLQLFGKSALQSPIIHINCPRLTKSIDK